MIANGICSVIQKQHQTLYPGEFQREFMLISMLAAAVIFAVAGAFTYKPTAKESPKLSSKKSLMLGALSGKTHQVITGVCLTTKNKQKTFSTVTDVTFASLTDEEIIHYVEHYLPMDKAGSYGIQEWIGFIGVESISGSYFNVVGMPIQRLYTELKKF